MRPTSALLTDLYHLPMFQACLEQGMNDTAVFELFVRRLPPGRQFLVAAGLEQALDYLENLSFMPSDLRWLAHQGRFSKCLLNHLADLRCQGDVEVW